MTDPWDRNAGKFDRPSSGLPGRALREPAPRRAHTSSLDDEASAVAVMFPSGFAIVDRAALVQLEPPARPIAPPKQYDDRPGRRIRRKKPE